MQRKSKTISVGGVPIGGGNPIVVQSMTNTDTRDVAATAAQIRRLEEAGCEIVRVAVVDEAAAEAIAKIRPEIHIPLIADIHFSYQLALKAIESGVDGLRINPGNIGEKWKVEKVVKACQERNIPIRIGVNTGSLDKKLLAKYGGVCADAMVESAFEHIHILEDLNFDQMKISLKASNVKLMVEAYEKLAEKCDYPLHLGVTEAGTLERSLVKSSLGLGLLLHEGIGDTIRVSITGDPVDEVWAAYEILRSLGLRNRGAELISCPTCGRCEISLPDIARKVDAALRSVPEPIKVAVMGCVVNGPGEAREADIGIAGGRGVGLLFAKDQLLRKVPEADIIPALMEEVERIRKEKTNLQ